MTWAVLYLHGVGDSVRNDGWYEALKGSLERHGVEVPELRSPRIIAPDYVELLKFPPTEGGSGPTRTVKDASPKEEALERRARYSREQSRLIQDLRGTVDARGLRNIVGGLDLARAPLPKDLKDAQHYLRNDALRRAVMHRVLGSLGGHRDLVVVAHSMGSLVAIDLLKHLPPTVRIRRLVTIGSPAGVTGIWKARPFTREDFPFHQVSSWINVLNPYDLITRGMGLTHLFPAAADVRVQLGTSHSAAAYLGHPVVGQILADAVQPTVAAVSSGTALDVALSRNETDILDSLAFAHLVRDHVSAKEKDKAARIEIALQALRDQVGRTLRRERELRGEPCPGVVAALESGEEFVWKFSHREIEQQLYFAVLMGTTNPLAPYEIDLSAEHLGAVESLWQAYGYTRPEAVRVSTALKESAALFTKSGLQRFLSGDTMLGRSSGLIPGNEGVESAFTFANRTPLEVGRSQIWRIVAFTAAHQSLDLPGDRTVGWLTLNAWASDLGAHLADLEAVSDKSAPSVVGLRAKVAVIERALGWLGERGLLPDAPAEDENDEAAVGGDQEVSDLDG